MNYDDIRDMLLLIKEETTEGGNTRQRVYDILKSMLDYTRQISELSSSDQLQQSLSDLRAEITKHYSSGMAHDARFSDILNIVDEKIEAIEVGSNDVDVTNLLRLYADDGSLLITTSDAHVFDNTREISATGEAGSSFMFTGVPSLLSAGRYNLSFSASNDVANDSILLVKAGGVEIPFTSAGAGRYSIEFSEPTSVIGVRYLLSNRRAGLLLSKITLVKGSYVGYSSSAGDIKAKLNSKVNLDLSNTSEGVLSSLTKEQVMFYVEDGLAKRTSLEELMRAITTIGRQRREVATVRDLKNRLYEVQQRMFQGSAVVYLNGQALFEECGDFVVMDERTIRITKENINDPHDTDKVVVEAIFINE